MHETQRMTKTATLLAIDAGNTRTKWGLFDEQGNLLQTGATLNSQLEVATFPSSKKVIIANVAGNVVAKTLVQKFSEAEIQFATSTANACGVVNHYEVPAQLGIDRWAALIGAWHLKKTSCVVVNAGTAMTIDALIAKDNEAAFIGGMILPGLDLMQNSLHTGTAQLPSVTENALNLGDFFGKNTHEAMVNGTLAATIGAISIFFASFVHKTQIKPQVLLSGGNAKLIQQNFFKEGQPNTVMESIETVENLVLHGLFWLHETRTP
jgi:type III pantothenate kinase